MEQGSIFFQLMVESGEVLHTPEEHFAAANAIVGFLVAGDDAARFNYREALSPEWLHEAQWHLGQAVRLGGGQHSAEGAHERLTRIGELFGWTRIRQATIAEEDGAELLEALKEHFNYVRSRGFRQYKHPVEFVLAAEFAFALARKMEKIRPADTMLIEGMRSDTQQFLAWAIEACGEVNLTSREIAACQYVIATSRACICMSDARNHRGIQQAAEDISMAMQLSQFKAEVLDLEWLEFLGDAERDPAYAIDAYGDGVLDESILAQRRPRLSTTIKYLGAARLADVVLPTGTLERLRSFVRPDINVPAENEKDGLHEIDFVQERWRIGREMFLSGDANGSG